MSTKRDPNMSNTTTGTLPLDDGAALHRIEAPAPAPNRIIESLITADNYMDIPPQRWFMPGWVIEGGTTAVYGEPGCGKSFWTLGLALEAARGGQWCLHDFRKPRRVLYIAPEAGRSHVERVRGWIDRHTHQWPATFHLADVQVNIYTDQAVSEIAQAIEELGPLDLVVLDTLASATAGLDENSSQMNVVTENLETIRRVLGDRAALIVVHHTGKDQTRGLRGHNSLLGYVTGSMLVTKENGNGTHKVEMKKVRDGKAPLPLYYRIETTELPPIVDEDGRQHAREVGVMVPVDYVEAATDTMTQMYETMLQHYRLGDTFTTREVLEVTGLGRGPVTKALNRGQDMGLWDRTGAGRTTRYRFIGRPGDVPALDLSTDDEVNA